MGTFGILESGESGTKSHSSNPNLDSMCGMALTNKTGQPPMAIELDETGVTELTVIPSVFRAVFNRCGQSVSGVSSASDELETEH